MNQIVDHESENQLQLLRLFLYAALLAVISVSALYGLSVQFEINQQIDWILVLIYSTLALLSYYFFVINDINAQKLNGRSMAVGFFVSYLALTLIAYSFVYTLPQKWVWYIAGIMLITGYLMCAFGLTKWAKHHKRIKQMMLHESLTDELTGLFNRRAFAMNASKELNFSVQSSSEFAVLILDIDDFKRVNDRYGHTVGDKVLKQLSHLVGKYTRHSDSIYRWGGEEFVVMMPVTGLFGANKVAQKIVRKVEEHKFRINEQLALNLTVSIGLAQWVTGESIIKETLHRADQALYKAKASGKNAVVVADYKEDKPEDFANDGQSLIKQISG